MRNTRSCILQEQGRVLEDGEAEMEALDLIGGVAYIVELKARDIQRRKLHRILTNGFKEPKLGPVDSEFFGSKSNES